MQRAKNSQDILEGKDLKDFEFREIFLKQEQ